MKLKEIQDLMHIVCMLSSVDKCVPVQYWGHKIKWFQVQIIVFRNDIDFGLDLKIFMCTSVLKREIYA